MPDNSSRDETADNWNQLETSSHSKPGVVGAELTLTANCGADGSSSNKAVAIVTAKAAEKVTVEFHTAIKP
jgi:hypothetical protein